jgi:hypothetical protein
MKDLAPPTAKVCPLLAAGSAARRETPPSTDDPHVRCLGADCAWWAEALPDSRCAFVALADQIDRLG